MRKYFYVFCALFSWAHPVAALSFHAPNSEYEKQKFNQAQKDLQSIHSINDLLDDKNKHLSDAEIEKDKIQRESLEEDTIKAVIAAYGIRPKHETGMLELGKLKWTKAVQWDPIFGEQQTIQ